jgi:hypothetical protein
MIANYKCAQQELYSICNHAWQSCNDYLAEFGAFRACYTAQFVQDRLQEVAAAMSLPEYQARSSQSESLRIRLVEITPRCIKLFNFLKRYIANAYPLSLQKTNIDAAGQEYYEKAAVYNWENMQGLLQNAVSFVQNNTTELIGNNDNMPATFLAELEQMQVNFQTLYQSFLLKNQGVQIATQDKIIANNAIYASLVNMLSDGQVLFSDNEAKLKQFVFSWLLNFVSGVATAGLKGHITDSVTGWQIAGAKISLLYKEKSAVTDSEGHYEINQVAAGLYTVIVAAEGYQDFVKENHEVKVGTVSNVHIALDKVV